MVLVKLCNEGQDNVSDAVDLVNLLNEILAIKPLDQVQNFGSILLIILYAFRTGNDQFHGRICDLRSTTHCFIVDCFEKIIRIMFVDLNLLT